MSLKSNERSDLRILKRSFSPLPSRTVNNIENCGNEWWPGTDKIAGSDFGQPQAGPEGVRHRDVSNNQLPTRRFSDPRGVFWFSCFQQLTHTGPALSCHKWTGVDTR
jgi:hypothetical protein